MDHLSHNVSPSPSIADMLANAVDGKQRLRKGLTSCYYALPEMDDYILRVNSRALKNHTMQEVLLHYTSLTPPDHLIVGANIGQTLVASEHDAVSIQRRQSGIPLEDYLMDCTKVANAAYAKKYSGSYDKRYAAADARMQVMKEIMNMSGFESSNVADVEHHNVALNPFLPLFDQACSLAHMGYTPNFYSKHIFIDSQNKKLGLVNQLSEHSEPGYHDPHADIDGILGNRLQQLFRDFAIEELPDNDQTHEYHDTFKVFKAFVEKAKKDTVYQHKAPGPLGFAAPPKQESDFLAFSHVDLTKGIALAKPSYTLLENLRKVQEKPGKSAQVGFAS